MKKLSYQTLKELNYDGYLLESAPERVLQFGEGNFLRAFVDYFIDKMNEMAGFNSALPTRSFGLSSAIQQKPELPMIRAASLGTVRQVPIRES